MGWWAWSPSRSRRRFSGTGRRPARYSARTSLTWKLGLPPTAAPPHSPAGMPASVRWNQMRSAAAQCLISASGVVKDEAGAGLGVGEAFDRVREFCAVQVQGVLGQLAFGAGERAPRIQCRCHGRTSLLMGGCGPDCPRAGCIAIRNVAQRYVVYRAHVVWQPVSVDVMGAGLRRKKGGATRCRPRSRRTGLSR